MNTAEDLKQLFGSRFPKAIDVAGEFLGIMDRKTLNTKIVKGEIGFPVFKAGDSNKAPWLVDIVDLAEWLDRRKHATKQ